MMNKKIIVTISSLAFVAGIFLFWSVGIKNFFHDYLYETPNLKGLTLIEANNLLEKHFKLINMEKHYSNVKKGEIYSQLPVAQKHIKYGRPIKIWISKGMDTVVLPDLKDKNIQDATVILSELGVKLQTVSHVMEGSMNNIVIGSDPQGGSLISRGSSVSLLVNISQVKNIRIPDVLGNLLDEGIRILRTKNLVIGNITKVYRTDFPNDTIIDISYSVGKEVLVGSVINITVTTKVKEE
uniref:PASTA domain-containing protein n=1 Tax=Hirondellea gigas TaxID=1518452 RepID=A0A6A7GDM5_9CRUS